MIRSVSPTLTSLLAELPSPRSREAYEAAWTKYTAWCKEERLDVLKAKPQDVKRYVAHLHESMKRTSVGQALSIVRMVYGALVTDGVIKVNPAREVKNPKTDDVLKTPVMTEEQMRALLSLPCEEWRDYRDRALLSVLFGLGWRRSEVAWMRADDFTGTTVYGIVKGHKELTVGVPEWVSHALEEWKAYARLPDGTDSAVGPLFPRDDMDGLGKARGVTCCAWCKKHDTPAAMTARMVYKAVKRAAARAGVPAAVATPHAFRRTNITLAGKRGVSLKERQLAVGHSSSATTERYDKAREAADNAPGNVFADLVKPEGK